MFGVGLPEIFILVALVVLLVWLLNRRKGIDRAHAVARWRPRSRTNAFQQPVRGGRTSQRWAYRHVKIHQSAS